MTEKINCEWCGAEAEVAVNRQGTKMADCPKCGSYGRTCGGHTVIGFRNHTSFFEEDGSLANAEESFIQPFWEWDVPKKVEKIRCRKCCCEFPVEMWKNPARGWMFKAHEGDDCSCNFKASATSYDADKKVWEVVS